MPILQILTTSPNRVVLTLDPSVPPPRVTPQELAEMLYRVLASLLIDTQPWLTWITCLALPKQSKVNFSCQACFIDSRIEVDQKKEKKSTQLKQLVKSLLPTAVSGKDSSKNRAE